MKRRLADLLFWLDDKFWPLGADEWPSRWRVVVANWCYKQGVQLL